MHTMFLTLVTTCKPTLFVTGRCNVSSMVSMLFYILSSAYGGRHASAKTCRCLHLLRTKETSPFFKRFSCFIWRWIQPWSAAISNVIDSHRVGGNSIFGSFDSSPLLIISLYVLFLSLRTQFNFLSINWMVGHFLQIW